MLHPSPEPLDLVPIISPTLAILSLQKPTEDRNVGKLGRLEKQPGPTCGSNIIGIKDDLNFR